MNQANSIDEVLDFAIERETEANKFYLDLAGKMDGEKMRKVFENFAKEEAGHKAKLEALKSGEPVVLSRNKFGLKITDYVVDVVPTPDMSYHDAIDMAMQKEEAAYQLYIDLAKEIENPDQRELFLLLAQEEARHKLRFEIEHDELQSKN